MDTKVSPKCGCKKSRKVWRNSEAEQDIKVPEVKKNVIKND